MTKLAVFVFQCSLRKCTVNPDESASSSHISSTTVRITKKQWRNQEFFSGGSTNSVEDRGQKQRGSGGGSPLVRGSGGSCNLVREISFHIVKFS